MIFRLPKHEVESVHSEQWLRDKRLCHSFQMLQQET